MPMTDKLVYQTTMQMTIYLMDVLTHKFMLFSYYAEIAGTLMHVFLVALRL